MERKRTWLPPRPTRWSCPCNNPIWPPFPRHAKRIWPLLRMMNCAAAGLDGRPWPWWPASLHGSFFVAHGAWDTLGNNPSICACSVSWFSILHLVFCVEPLAFQMPIWLPIPRHAKRIWPLLPMTDCAAAGLDGRPLPWWPASLHGSFFLAHGAWDTLGNSPSICTCSDSWFPILHLVRLPCGTTCLLNAMNGSCWSHWMCNFQQWHDVWGIGANCWPNALIAYQLHCLLQSNHELRWFWLSSPWQVTGEAVVVHMWCACWGTWDRFCCQTDWSWQQMLILTTFVFLSLFKINCFIRIDASHVDEIFHLIPDKQLPTTSLPCKHHPPFVLQFDQCSTWDTFCCQTDWSWQQMLVSKAFLILSLFKINCFIRLDASHLDEIFHLISSQPAHDNHPSMQAPSTFCSPVWSLWQIGLLLSSDGSDAHWHGEINAVVNLQSEDFNCFDGRWATSSFLCHMMVHAKLCKMHRQLNISSCSCLHRSFATTNHPDGGTSNWLDNNCKWHWNEWANLFCNSTLCCKFAKVNCGCQIGGIGSQWRELSPLSILKITTTPKQSQRPRTRKQWDWNKEFANMWVEQMIVLREMRCGWGRGCRQQGRQLSHGRTKALLGVFGSSFPLCNCTTSIPKQRRSQN